jgi:hypothetical protein
VHFVHRDRIVRNAKGLKAKNLEPANLTSIDIDAPGFWNRTEYSTRIREDVAFASIAEGRIWMAMNILVFVPISAAEHPGTTIRRLDFAVGIAAWLDWSEGLDQVIETSRAIIKASEPGAFRDTLIARTEKWTSPELNGWKQRRWNPAHPLRWAGRSIARSQISQIVLQMPEGEGP